MADIGHAHHEYYGGNGSGNHDSPDGPRISAARIGNSEQSNRNATLNKDSSGSVEKLGDEEELRYVLVSRFQFERGDMSNLDTVHFVKRSDVDGKLARSVEAADYTQTSCDCE